MSDSTLTIAIEFLGRLGYVSVLSHSCVVSMLFFFFSSRRRHTRFDCDWSSDVCSSDLFNGVGHLSGPFCLSKQETPDKKCVTSSNTWQERELRTTHFWVALATLGSAGRTTARTKDTDREVFTVSDVEEEELSKHHFQTKSARPEDPDGRLSW